LFKNNIATALENMHKNGSTSESTPLTLLRSSLLIFQLNITPN